MSLDFSEDFSRYDRKLEFILRTAARIFAEKGYHSTSMRDISRETGVSLAGLYYYCKSKEELLFLIQDNCFGRVLERLERRMRETDDAVEKLRLVIENHLSFFAANMSEMKVLSHEADSLAGEMHEHVSGKKQQYTRLVRRILSEAQGATLGDGGARRSVDLTVATYALFGMMNWIYNWYDPGGKLSVTELVDNITRLFLSGFLSGSPGDARSLAPSAEGAERLSVWRATQT
ncbi:MAG TPA: TetR/AcrR family transcriptional regulator [Pyrinomonadaceae bacterium]|jgi:AcrR family transcriptional regulator|nr:TetR/AcrR family transcriptional regulator [Pyrinomonadaceae bacterium]